MEKLSFNELASEGERLCKSGDCLNGIKFFESALDVHEKGLTHDLDNIKVLQTLSIIYNQMGNAFFYLQNYRKALEFHKKDLQLSEQFGDESGMAKACGNIGNTLQLLGEYDEAIQYSLRNLDISKRLGDLTGEARALYNLGNIYQSKGKHMGRLLCNRDPTEFPFEVKEILLEAVSYYRKTLDLVRNKDRAAEGRTYGNLGNTYYLLGEFEMAIECHSERLKIAKEYGDRPAERRAYSNLGNAYIFMGKFTEASEFYLKAMNVAKILGDRAIEAQTYYSLGNTYTLLQDYAIAIDYHLRHLQIAKQLEDRIGESRAYWSLGNCYAALNEIENAISYANKHLEVAKEIGDASSELTAKMNLYDFQNLLGGYSRESEIGLYTPKTTKTGGSFKKSNTFESLADNHQDSLAKLNDPTDTSFLEVLSRAQSKRLDDQRCSFRLLPNANRANQQSQQQQQYQNNNNNNNNNYYSNSVASTNSSKLSNRELIANKLLENENKNDDNQSDDLFELIMKSQGSRLEDQRSMLLLPNSKSQQHNHSSNLSSTSSIKSNASQKLNFQQATQKPQAITVPPQDDDFISLLQKVQSRRLDEQRSEIPKSFMIQQQQQHQQQINASNGFFKQPNKK